MNFRCINLSSWYYNLKCYSADRSLATTFHNSPLMTEEKSNANDSGVFFKQIKSSP